MHNSKLIGKCSLCDGPVITTVDDLVICMFCHAIGKRNDVLHKSLPVINMVSQTPKYETIGYPENYYG